MYLFTYHHCPSPDHCFISLHVLYQTDMQISPSVTPHSLKVRLDNATVINDLRCIFIFVSYICRVLICGLKHVLRCLTHYVVLKNCSDFSQVLLFCPLLPASSMFSSTPGDETLAPLKGHKFISIKSHSSHSYEAD